MRPGYACRTMNKAFTRETDSEDDDLPPGACAVPAGARNYITPAGYARLRAELLNLIDEEREIDRRIRFLTKRLEIAEVTDPCAHHGRDQVFFGATVRYASEDGSEREITILGIDEADSSLGQVSWISPIARALLKAREGDEVKLLTPAGVQTIEVLQVRYPAP
jgi:transcription elongation factor GreB